MMYGVVFPHSRAMEEAVRPIQDDVFADEKDHHLRDQWQRREWPMAVVVECDETFGCCDVEEGGSADDQQADAQIAGDHRNEEPIAQVGHEISLVPPGAAWIAGPECREKSEDDSKSDRDRDAFQEGLADADDKCA